MGFILDLLYPARCVVCGATPAPLCSLCQAPPKVTNVRLDDFKLSFARDLDQDSLAIIRSFKDSKLVAISGYLTFLLDAAIAVQPEFDAFALPPRNPSNFRLRGFHPIQYLVDRSAQLAGRQQVRPSQVRSIRDQRLLSRVERQGNLKQALAFPSGAARLLLVDDVVTSGATLREMARSARSSGFDVVGSCAIAYSSSGRF